jgi:hypothetical protein
MVAGQYLKAGKNISLVDRIYLALVNFQALLYKIIVSFNYFLGGFNALPVLLVDDFPTPSIL